MPSPRIRTESAAGRRRLISLTPLIDVVFILLVFFMLAATAPRWESIRLDAPVRASAEDAGPPALILRLDANGGLSLNDQAMSPDMMVDALRTALEAAPDRPVVVQPARGVPLQRVVTLLNRLSGVAAVSLMRGGPEKQ